MDAVELEPTSGRPLFAPFRVISDVASRTSRLARLRQSLTRSLAAEPSSQHDGGWASRPTRTFVRALVIVIATLLPAACTGHPGNQSVPRPTDVSIATSVRELSPPLPPTTLTVLVAAPGSPAFCVTIAESENLRDLARNIAGSSSSTSAAALHSSISELREASRKSTGDSHRSLSAAADALQGFADQSASENDNVQVVEKLQAALVDLDRELDRTCGFTT